MNFFSFHNPKLQVHNHVQLFQQFLQNFKETIIKLIILLLIKIFLLLFFLFSSKLLILLFSYLQYLIYLFNLLLIRPLAFDRYDHLEPLSNIMCFIVVRSSSGSIDYVGILLRIFFYDFPFLIVLFFDLYAAIKIATYFRNNFSEIDKMRSVKNIMLYPLVLFLSWIWIIIQRFAELV